MIRKTQRLRNELASDQQPARIDTSSGAGLVALLTAAERSGAIRVLDFGGAAGAHYFGTPEKDFQASTSNCRQEPRFFEPLIHADTGEVRFHKEGLRIPLDTLSDAQNPSKP